MAASNNRRASTPRYLYVAAPLNIALAIHSYF